MKREKEYDSLMAAIVKTNKGISKKIEVLPKVKSSKEKEGKINELIVNTEYLWQCLRAIGREV